MIGILVKKYSQEGCKLQSALKSDFFSFWNENTNNLIFIDSLHLFQSEGSDLDKRASKRFKLNVPIQVTLVVKQNKQIEVPVSEVKTLARRNGAVIKTYIDRSCTHVICSAGFTY